MMGKRFNLITISGFKIGIDISWFFIAILFTWSLAVGYFPFRYPHLTTGTYWLMGLVGMLALFICVILHELGHAIVARHYKLPTTQITLFLFGGVAEIQKEPTSPKVEFLMAIAGPIVSIIIAFAMYFLAEGEIFWGWPIYVIGITSYLAFINLALAIFNLLPAFPLDGGRVFRSILWGWKKNLDVATKIATQVGSGFGIAFIFFGIFSIFFGNLFGGFWLMILGWFLHRAAVATRTQYYVTKELEGEKVSKFMKKDVVTVSPEITIKEFIDHYIYQTHHHLYPVTDQGKLEGYITLKEVKTVGHNEWEKTQIKKVMVPTAHFQTISPQSSAMDALNLMQKTDAPMLLVVENGKLCGLISTQDLFKLISMKLELKEKRD